MANHNSDPKKNAQREPQNVPLVPAKVTNPKEVKASKHKRIHDDEDDVPQKGLLKGVQRADRYAIYLATAVLIINLLTLWQAQIDSRRGYRAWVGLEKGLHTPIIAGKKVQCDLRFTNTGKTPAMDLKGTYTMLLRQGTFDVAAFAKAHEDDPSTDISSQGAVPANATIIIHAFSAMEISDTTIGKLKTGELLAYVFGEITYRDIFRDTHRTRYCCIVEPGTEQLRVHNQYNDMN